MPHTVLGEVPKHPEDLQEPQNHGNHYDAVEDSFDLSLHGDEAVNQP